MVRHCKRPVLLFYPMEQPQGAHLEGVSRKKVLQGEADLSRNDVIVEWNPGSDGILPSGVGSFSEEDAKTAQQQHWRSIVSHENWKLSLCDCDQGELYDLIHKSVSYSLLLMLGVL